MIELIRMAQRGNPEAFARLMERSKQSMYKVARAYLSIPMDVDDAISEAVLTCWVSIGKLRQPEYFRTWLVRIVINKCKDILSERCSTVPLEQLAESEQPSVYDESTDFDRLIMMLDERYRPVLVLYYGENMRIREISEATGIPEGTVSSHLKRGREQLAERLRKDGII